MATRIPRIIIHAAPKGEEDYVFYVGVDGMDLTPAVIEAFGPNDKAPYWKLHIKPEHVEAVIGE